MPKKTITIKLKNGRKKKVVLGPKRLAQRRAFVTTKWTSGKIALFERGELRARSWFSLSKGSGVFYISRHPGTRTYWILSKIPQAQWPKIRWSDKNFSFTVNATRIVFKSSAEYLKAKTIFYSLQKKR